MERSIVLRIVEIYKEMMEIYKKYFDACETMGTISMSDTDKQRLQDLEKELKKLR